MQRKKILFCSEASFMPTGYSVYTREVLSRLNRNPNFEVAELACYCDPSHHHVSDCDWKVYPNQPPKDSPEHVQYKSSPINEFGEFSFNGVLLDFMPDFVMDIRDWWMLEFEQRSPFRDFFNWAIMPTVDAEPQNSQWIETYASADAVYAYSEFGRDVMLKQCPSINFQGIASPCASDTFAPVKNKKTHKTEVGLHENSIIIGTVMRNQRRKLYPDLFKVFSDLIKSSQNPNIFLYCHTYFPDVGWDIPELLSTYGLSNRVLFTYRCKKCNSVTPSFFNDVYKFCSKCGSFDNHLVGINNQMSESDLAKIYNLFDVYIQYANSEGFGMPQLEAAKCGVPVASIDYSAMSSVIKQIDGIPLAPLTYSTECETGCLRAVPNNDHTLLVLNSLVSLTQEQRIEQGMKMRSNCIKNYSWDDTARAWSDYFESTPARPLRETWHSPINIFTPSTDIPEGLSDKDYVNVLFERVLGKPEWIGGCLWKRTLKDIIYRASVNSTMGDIYFNESHVQDNVQSWQSFDRNAALKSMLEFRNYINSWETARQTALEQLPLQAARA